MIVKQLMNHMALGMHYVYGTPLDQPMPTVLEVMAKGDVTTVRKAPGSLFGYSGGGFLLLQHLLEIIHCVPTDVLFSSYLNKLTSVSGSEDENTREFCFDQRPEARLSASVAIGYRDTGERVQANRLMFPALAAGGLGSAQGLARFLRHLALAYHCQSGSGDIPHATARAMLDGAIDCGAVNFMNCEVGLGVFVGKAGSSRFMVHQAANDGFRGVRYFVIVVTLIILITIRCTLYASTGLSTRCAACMESLSASCVYRYTRRGGPSGLVVLANGDNAAVSKI